MTARVCPFYLNFLNLPSFLLSPSYVVVCMICTSLIQAKGFERQLCHAVAYEARLWPVVQARLNLAARHNACVAALQPETINLIIRNANCAKRWTGLSHPHRALRYSKQEFIIVVIVACKRQLLKIDLPTPKEV